MRNEKYKNAIISDEVKIVKQEFKNEQKNLKEEHKLLLTKINENKKALQQLNKKPRKQTNRYSVKTLLFRSLNIEDGFIDLHSSFIEHKLGSYSIDNLLRF